MNTCTLGYGSVASWDPLSQYVSSQFILFKKPIRTSDYIVQPSVGRFNLSSSLVRAARRQAYGGRSFGLSLQSCRGPGRVEEVGAGGLGPPAHFHWCGQGCAGQGEFEATEVMKNPDQHTMFFESNLYKSYLSSRARAFFAAVKVVCQDRWTPERCRNVAD